MLGRKKTKFFRWFRTLPLLALLVAYILASAFSWLPQTIIRSWFFPVHYAQTINQAATTYSLDPYLVSAMIKCESDWDESATSQAGAEGLMQMMPETAEYLVSAGAIDGSKWNAQNLYDPQTNIMFGCCYLSKLMRESDSQAEAIAAYNAGPSIAATWASQALSQNNQSLLDVISYPETRFYVMRVDAVKANYERFYPDGLKDVS